MKGQALFMPAFLYQRAAYYMGRITPIPRSELLGATSMRSTPTLYYLATLLAVLLVTGCTSNVPPELVEANLLEKQALINIRGNRAVIVNAYTQELRSAYSAQMDLIQTHALDQAQVPGTNGKMVVPRAIAEEVMKLRAEREAQIDADLEKKRKEFLADANLTVAEDLNSRVGDWLRVYVEEFAGRLQELTRISGELYKEASGDDDVPGFFKTVTGD